MSIAPSHFNMQAIGVVESCFKEKFAIPRQSGLMPSATASIRLLPPFDLPDTVRGLERFSHIWVVFLFHATSHSPWKPTVRPPKLGGNTRVGVFASRATHRPNSIGMSAVALAGIDVKSGVTLHLRGADLLDGTPVLDIKPYLPYADAIPHASNGYADTGDAPARVEFLPEALASLAQLAGDYPSLHELIVEVLGEDPRPGYAQDASREYGMTLYDLNINWRSSGELATVIRIGKI